MPSCSLPGSRRPHFLALCLFLSSACFAQTFTVSVSPTSLTIHPGDQNIPISVTVGSSSYSEPINITLTQLPSGITVTPLVLTAGSTGMINLSASVNADQEAFPASAAGNANTKTNSVLVVGAAGTTKNTAKLALTVSLTNPSYTPTEINLPIVRIDTSGVPIVDGITDVPGTITITNADGSVSYLPNASDADTTAAFHLHGHSTASMPKKAYHIKLTTSLDLLNVMGLSCPYITNGKAKPTCDKSKTYILLANYADKTLLRDWAASALANAIPIGGSYLSEQATTGTTPPSPSGTATVMPWASHSLFVELFLNGVYQGNYQLIEKVKVDSHRVNITELAETDTTDDITGGYLMEIDHHKDEAFVWTTPQGLPIGLIDPDFTPDPEVPEQTTYISEYVNQAETALFSSTFTDPATGWRNYFDEASAVNWYIVNDVMGNVDGGDFESSDYLYKAIDNQYLYMGPIWDFDISSGNVNYESISNPTVPWTQKAKWYAQWFKDPSFKADVIKQWNQLKADGVLTSWITSIGTQAATLEQSQANNFARWPMIGERVWPNPEAYGSYDAEVSYLTNWLTLRIAYLDSLFNGKAATKTSLTVPSGTLRSGSPVQLSATITGGSSPTGSVSFTSNGILLGTAPLTAGTASGSFSLPTGTDSLAAVYGGDSTNGLSAASAKKVTVLAPLVASTASLPASTTSAAYGSSVSFPVSVLGDSGSTTPSGTVTFTSNGAALGSAKLSSGSVTFMTKALKAGADSVVASYGGDSNFSASSSPAVTVTVAPQPTCAPPSSSGVNICSPMNNSTVSSPFSARAAANLSGTLDRMDVWADGVKKYSETSSKTLSTSLSLSAGKHRIDVHAVNKSGTNLMSTVSVTVK